MGYGEMPVPVIYLDFMYCLKQMGMTSVDINKSTQAQSQNPDLSRPN